MSKKAIVHILTKARMESSAFNAEIDAMEDISEKYQIKNILFYKGDVIKFESLIKKLEKFHILCKHYSNKEDLKEQVLEYKKNHEIIFVDTPLELLINTVSEIKETLGFAMSDNTEVFRDKFLQRELIQNHNPELGIKFIKGSPEDLDIKEIEIKVGYPFIIKPIDGVQSSGVAKINNKNEFNHYIDTYKDFHDRLKSRGVDSKELIVEEFINGKLYSIDYLVKQDGEIRISKPVKVRLGIDVKVDDYCNIARIATEKTELEFKGKRLKTFVNGTIKATGIRNTFVHHEFKINSKGEFKTIELNGRIGGGRIELLQRAYNFNLYELLLNSDIKNTKLKESNIAVNIYATKRGILKGFNKKLFEKIESRKSVFDIKYEDNVIGKEIGLTKDGFIKVGVIKLKNKNYSELAKDFSYIKSKYSELLEIEKIEEIKKGILVKPKKKIKSAFARVTGIFRKK